jgi:ABC-type branched-subunit amino acid transport system ATPase component/ABC-type branched-subunit amino acid transport system permease subunit
MRARITWSLGALAALVAIATGAQGASIATRASASAVALAGIVVLTGWSGQLNLHAAAVGLGWGAYAAAALSAFGAPPLVALLGAPFVAAVPAVLLGAAAIRFRGLELAIATLAAGFVCEHAIFPSLGRAFARGDGETALALVERPGFASGDGAFALLAVILAAGVLALTAWAGARAGGTLRAVRDREILAESRGIASAAWRLGAFVASVVLGATAGAIGAAHSGVVTPEAFPVTLSLQLFAVALIAGVEHLDRVVIGAVVVTGAAEAGSIDALRWVGGDRADLVFGIALLVVLARRSRARTTAAAASTRVAPGTGAAVRRLRTAPAVATALRVEGVTVRFGARTVLDGVDLRVGRGEVVGLVGGNGAGKTTLLNVITGLVAPDRGSVFLGGDDLTLAAPHRRARAGLGRTFQGGALFDGTALEVVTATVRSPEHALTALHEAGVAHLADAPVSGLRAGDARLVEIAAAIAAEPTALLLDEPLAGLDADERERVIGCIGDARTHGLGVLIIEHDHRSLARVCDRIVTLDAGRIATTEVTRAARA